MKAKRFIKATIIFLCVLLIPLSVVNFIFDPLFQYHEPFFEMQPVMLDEEYQMAGIAKTYDYDNVIIGNSLSENFDLDRFDSAFGKTFNFSIPGAFSNAYEKLIKILSGRSPKKIFIQIDPLYLTFEDIGRTCELPDYLYNSVPFDDISYLCNLSVFINFTLPMIKHNRENTVPAFNKVLDWGDLHKTQDRFLPDETEANGFVCDRFDEWDNTDAMLALCRKNLSFIRKYAPKMPDTEFIFFFSPPSMFFWSKAVSENKAELIKSVYLEACSDLCGYDNVRVFLCADDKMLTAVSDEENYYDWIHFGDDIFRLLTDSFANGTGELTADTYKTEINAFFDLIINRNYQNELDIIAAEEAFIN